MDQLLRRPRLAFLLLPTLDHFAQDLIERLPTAIRWDVRGFLLANLVDFHAALAWTDRPDIDALWFEFCWPPFPHLIAQTDFAGRRVIVRVHRIEAMETNHVAQTRWQKVSDVIIVSADMAARVRKAAPELDNTTRLHLVHNGLDVDRFAPLEAWNRHRIGWCGLMTLRKNPVMALQILSMLRSIDPRYHMHVCSNGGEPLATESFFHLLHHLGLTGAVHLDGRLPQADMPAWHAHNGILLHTSLHESFGYAIAEAAAVGCDIAVLENPGAAEFWPVNRRFGTVDEAARMVCEAEPYRWRKHIAQNFSLGQQIAGIEALLNVAVQAP
jgi:glycosyltransferase involved in cell wall biosynthesis